MSKVAREKILLNTEIKVEYQEQNNELYFDGKFGKSQFSLPEFLKAVIENDEISIIKNNDTHESNKQEISMHGTSVRLLKNIVKGLTIGFNKTLSITGIGYKCLYDDSKRTLTFHLGYSTPKLKKVPENIKVTLTNPTTLNIFSPSNCCLGDFCYQICNIRKYNKYNGAGIWDNSKEKPKNKPTKKAKK